MINIKLSLDSIYTFPNVSGIYAIKCIPSGTVYVGSSRVCRNRIRRHIHDLNSGIHHSIYLQRAWNKYGEDAFNAMLIETCAEKNLLRNEQRYLNIEKNKKKSFNICFVAGNCAGVKQSDETKEKRAKKLRGSKRTPEQCRRISEARKINGISKEHQELLNKISSKRRFLLTKKQALRYADMHMMGNRWAYLANLANISPKIFRREIKRHVKAKYLLKAIHYQPKMSGEDHPLCKLKKKDVINIFKSSLPDKLLAKKYGVTSGHIYDIKNKRTWKHIHE
jgi:group I intron endonuclease